MLMSFPYSTPVLSHKKEFHLTALFKNTMLCFVGKSKLLPALQGGSCYLLFQPRFLSAQQMLILWSVLQAMYQLDTPQEGWTGTAVTRAAGVLCCLGRGGCCHCWFRTSTEQQWCSQLVWLELQHALSCGCRKELILSFVLASWNAKELINCSLKVLSSPETYRICFFIWILSPLKPLFPDSIHIFQQLIFSFA